MKYSFFLMLSLLFSCNKDNPVKEVVDTQIDIFIEDASGNNLLTGASSNPINFDSIKLMYLISGTSHTVYNSDLDCPRAICLISDTGIERVRIFPNDEVGEEYPITYIDWGNGDIDTLKCHFLRKDNDEESSIVCDKVWLNDTPMFPDNAITEFGRAFKIVK
ncbi:MAG: hypothetical protein H6573_20765 [Lewinellaceae bacterium]|nr:hypothetical protein [Lewinellaceae bacterium]